MATIWSNLVNLSLARQSFGETVICICEKNVAVHKCVNLINVKMLKNKLLLQTSTSIQLRTSPPKYTKTWKCNATWWAWMLIPSFLHDMNIIHKNLYLQADLVFTTAPTEWIYLRFPRHEGSSSPSWSCVWLKKGLMKMRMPPSVQGPLDLSSSSFSTMYPIFSSAFSPLKSSGRAEKKNAARPAPCKKSAAIEAIEVIIAKRCAEPDESEMINL